MLYFAATTFGTEKWMLPWQRTFLTPPNPPPPPPTPPPPNKQERAKTPNIPMFAAWTSPSDNNEQKHGKYRCWRHGRHHLATTSKNTERTDVLQHGRHHPATTRKNTENKRCFPAWMSSEGKRHVKHPPFLTPPHHPKSQKNKNQQVKQQKHRK